MQHFIKEKLSGEARPRQRSSVFSSRRANKLQITSVAAAGFSKIHLWRSGMQLYFLISSRIRVGARLLAPSLTSPSFKALGSILKVSLLQNLVSSCYTRVPIPPLLILTKARSYQNITRRLVDVGVKCALVNRKNAIKPIVYIPPTDSVLAL